MEHIVQMAEKYPGLAAWIQAIFSVIAIVAAGLFPVFQECLKKKTTRRSWTLTFKWLADRIGDMASRVSEVYSSESGLLGASHAGDADEYMALVKAINALPLPAHADQKHLDNFLQLKGIAETWDWKWRLAVAHGEEFARDPFYDDPEDRDRLRWLTDSTERLVKEIA